MQYDTQTLYLHELYVSGILLQIAVASLDEVVKLTKDASALETFFEEIEQHDWADMVKVDKGAKLANPVRQKAARGLLKSRLKEITAVLRLAASVAETQAKKMPVN